MDKNKEALVIKAVLAMRKIYREAIAEGGVNGWTNARLDRMRQIRYALINEGFSHSQVLEMVNCFDPANPNEVTIPAIAKVA